MLNESNKNKVIDISNFSSGLYFVVVSIEGNVSSEKIVKNFIKRGIIKIK